MSAEFLKNETYDLNRYPYNNQVGKKADAKTKSTTGRKGKAKTSAK
jgi:hypothetical protein